MQEEQKSNWARLSLNDKVMIVVWIALTLFGFVAFAIGFNK
jgi:hypothetical protein